MLRAYSRVVNAPGVPRLALAVIVGGLELGFAPIGLILLVQQSTGSYGAAGGVLAAYGIGRAVATPAQGRLLDRLGPPRVLAPCALLHLASIAVLLIASGPGAVALLVAAGAAAGATFPALTSALRALWPDIVGPERRVLGAAYAFDALILELLFVTGVAVGGAIVAFASPAAALAATAAGAAVGTALFLTVPVARAPARAARTDSTPVRPSGPLGVASVRVLLSSWLPVGFAYGTFEVVAPAFAQEQEAASAAALFLLLVAIGSVVGAAWYGARAAAKPPHRVLTLALGLLAPALALSSQPETLAGMAFAAFLIGLPYAPLSAANSQLLCAASPAATRTESFAWVTTALFVGGAVGSALTGIVIDLAGWREAALVGAAIVAVTPAILSFGLLRARVALPGQPHA